MTAPLGAHGCCLGSVGSLMMQAEYQQALALLQELDKRLPAANNSQYLQQMLAEAAYRTGNKQLALETYRKRRGNRHAPARVLQKNG